MFGMGPWEMLLIFLVVLLLFGAKKLPEIAQGLGKGIREFKKAMRDTTDDINQTPVNQPPRLPDDTKNQQPNSH
jgi:sec-independent protein translocase protein TatA